ncbi:phosphoglucosamine mutase, partial [Gordonia effusa NBRC 100432]
MSSRLFGTDGVRGRANADLTPEIALRLAAATAQVLGNPGKSDHPPVIVGRDPRASGEMLEAAVCAGLAAEGIDAIRVGVVPTPAVAFLTADYSAAFGVMISASHNPMPDNGIKIFGPGGHKLDDAVEDRIEAVFAGDLAHTRPVGAGVGRLRDAPDASDRYLAHLAAQISHPLDGLTVVVDCANGSASRLGPMAYRAAGATVVEIYAEPDGLNINDGCGSTHLGKLQAAVLEHGADLGLAHDGDADRCLAVDSTGTVVDGDIIMAILATAMAQAGRLKDGVLVATVMSNLGLHIAMREAGITLRTTAVGDRYVLEELRAGGYSLGGEQSGHIVLPGAGTTGDGVLTGLLLMEQIARSGRRLADLASV